MPTAGAKLQAASELPPLFLERMRSFLGDEYDPFVSSYFQPPQTGLRVNLLKTSPEQLFAILPFKLDPIPWSRSGFHLLDFEDGQISPGKHPYHAAGLFYLQEPSAMLAAEILAPQPGEKILDLCAAPGGKATHIASLMRNKGLFVANEIHPKRVWDLAENLERWGVRNTIITNETPEHLAEFFGPYFDRVLVDAPCSGEGLFRKDADARSHWTLKFVEGCAIRQVNILHAAARLVRSGGFLAYSTCTYAPEENEGTLDRFLDNHPEFNIVDFPHQPGIDSGHPDWLTLSGDTSLKSAFRMWPHRIHGEGHFVAVLQKRWEGLTPVSLPKAKRGVPKAIFNLFQQFIRDNSIDFSVAKNLSLNGAYLYAGADDWPDLSPLHVIHPGWWLGTIKKGRFEPAHALAMSLEQQEIHNFLSLSSDELDLHRYLRGENISARHSPSGWVVVLVDGFSLGWGKSVQGVIKNAYPRGLRWF